jgi:hypothetical protein
MYKIIQCNVCSECNHYHNEGLTDDDIHDHDDREWIMVITKWQHNTYDDSNGKSGADIHVDNP